MRVGKDEKCCINCAIQQDKECLCEECRFEHIDYPSLFYRFTRSPELLAPKFVYYDYSACDGNGIGYPWCSTLFSGGGHFETEEKAIAATLEKLKEVEKCQ